MRDLIMNTDDDDWFLNPRPVQIATIEQKQLKLNETVWQKCCAVDNDAIKDLPVSIICVTGGNTNSASDPAIIFSTLLQCIMNAPDDLPKNDDENYENENQHDWLNLSHSLSTFPTNSLDQKKPTANNNNNSIQLFAWSRPIVRTLASHRTSCAIILLYANAEWDTKNWSSGRAKMLAFCALLANTLVVDVRSGMGVTQRIAQTMDFVSAFQRSLAHLLGPTAAQHCRVLNSLILLCTNLGPDYRSRDDVPNLGVHEGRELKNMCAGDISKQLLAFADSNNQCVDNFTCALLPMSVSNDNKDDKSHQKNSDVPSTFGDLPKRYLSVAIALAETISATLVPKSLGGYQLTCEELYNFSCEYARVLADDGAAPDVPRLASTCVDNSFSKICRDKINKLQQQHQKSHRANSTPQQQQTLQEKLLAEFDAETAGGDYHKVQQHREQLEQALSSSAVLMEKDDENDEMASDEFDVEAEKTVSSEDEVLSIPEDDDDHDQDGISIDDEEEEEEGKFVPSTLDASDSPSSVQEPSSGGSQFWLSMFMILFGVLSATVFGVWLKNSLSKAYNSVV